MPDTDEQLDEFDAFLTEARRALSTGYEIEIPIRNLLRYAGASRRGARVLENVRSRLDQHGLTTEPSFATGWVDNPVALRLIDDGQVNGAGPQDPEARPHFMSEEVSLTVRNFQSASGGLQSVQRNSDLALARAYMLRYDYSQLAVMAGERQLVGAVSWESMALAAIRDPHFTLTDATVPATTVDLDDDLVALIPVIAEKGFVFVIGRDRKPAGIVTTADLSIQFQTLAGPFLVLGEIERRLRLTLSVHFSVAELASVRDPQDTKRTIDSVNDLTLGETLRMLESRENWQRLSWPVDRAEFIDALNEVKAIRNEVMHFSPDPLSDDQQSALTNFVGWLRALEPVGAT